MTTVTVVEMPDDLDLPFADQSQSEDAAVCESLAGDGDVGDASETCEVTEDDVVDEAKEMAAGGSDTESISESAGDVAPDHTTSQSASPAHQTAPSQPAAEMVNLIELITDAESECRFAEDSVNELKEQLKEAKKHYDDCVKRLRTFAGKLTKKQQKQPTTVGDQEEQISQEQAVGDQQSNQQPEQQSEQQSEQDANAWRSVPLADIGVASIKGLGTKKYEALIELCPTLGAFEDLRSRVGRSAASLPDLMPTGIGQAICDQLEDIVLDWLSRHRQPETQREESQVESQPQRTPADTPPSVQSLHEAIVTRAGEINTGEPGCLDSKHDKGIWESGYRSYEQEAELWECPWTPGDNQDEWIRGWCAAQAVESYEGKSKADEQTGRPITTTDDIDAL